MSVLISDDDYKEFMILQSNAVFQQKLRSVEGMNTLENDIDKPIKRLVAMFALLDCKPLWSCCGFDYPEQPMHKTHEYGASFIAFRKNDAVERVITILQAANYVVDLESKTNKWEHWTNGHIYLRTDFDYYHSKMDYPWTMRSCIHFPELAIIQIHEMEQMLFKFFGSEFLDEVVLSDTNYKQKKQLRNWQYPVLKDWTIKKEDIFE
jgi:hypothetical protein